MTTVNFSQVHGSQAPSHHGSGNQFFLAGLTAETLLRFRPRVPGPWSDERLRWLKERFLKPGGFQEAKIALARDSAVMLRGEAGSGRRATALILLDEPEHGRGYFHETFPTPDFSGHNPWDVSELDVGDRVLLDLSDADEEVHKIVDRELTSYCAAVKARGARLVVVAHDRYELSGHLWMAVRIERPDPSYVLARYLKVEGFDFTDAPPEPGLADFLGKAPVHTVVTLVDLMQAARSNDSTGGFVTWRHNAFTALEGGAKAVADHIRKLKPGRPRALILAAAMFCGLPADAAFGAAASLLAVVDYPADERHLLDRRDFAEELRKIGAEIDPQRRIRFDGLAFDAAARAHFWDTLPNLRPKLRFWLDRAVREPALTAEDRDELVRRFAEQCLRIGRIGDLGFLISRLTKTSETGRGAPLARHAVLVLEQGLQDEHYGHLFRRQTYEWSRSPRISDGLASAIVEVCVGSLCESYPEQALVRLHYLTRRRGDVGDLACRVLVEFVAEDNRLLRRLLHRIAHPERREDLVRRDGKLFLHLADPYRLVDGTTRSKPLVADNTIRRYLVSGWRAEMNGGSSGLLGVRTRDWLQAAATGPGGLVLLDILAEASAGSFAASSDLEAEAYSWARDTDGERASRARVVRSLSCKIDNAPPPGTRLPAPDNATVEAAQ
ncbi:MAG TPA: hypothetical protein VGX23_03750 [Actinocrinis sp.]|nr:hypothetical protein [Actinocrinis sp.]